MSKNYLYGASVQGIQSFIFETNKLKEIIGASEMVETISTELYKEIIDDLKDDDILLSAAGNIKIKLTEDQCKKMCIEFPKKVMEYAPGITLSQAVVEFTEQNNLLDQLNELDKRLRIARNKIQQPLYMGYMGAEHCRRTGNVAVDYSRKKAICKSVLSKREHGAKDNIEDFKLLNKIAAEHFFAAEQSTDQTDDLKVGDNSFIAVIHADGNGLGNLIQNLRNELNKKKLPNEEVFNILKSFSQALDKATSSAAKDAYNNVTNNKKLFWDTLPIRPIVMGGDDLTLLIQADMALDFTQNFLKNFQENTKNKFSKINVLKDLPELENGLTACAGIAFVKAKFPMHYALDLAEQLCQEAKVHTKRTASGLSFFKVYDSHIGSLKDMRERVSTLNNGESDYKAYNLKKLEILQTTLKALDENADDTKKGTSKLRQWISELSKDSNAAKFMLNRVKDVNKDFYTSLGTDEIQIIYDAMQIHDLK